MPKTRYIWDPVTSAYLMEKDGSGVTTAVYTQEPVPYGRLISQRRGGVTSYHHYDALGSTRALTNSAQAVTDTNLYDAWGVNVAETGSTENPFKWLGAVGYYFDAATAGYYVRARNYSSTRGRWTTFDPVAAVDSQASMHGYLYRPRFQDPSGLKDCWEYGRKKLVKLSHGDYSAMEICLKRRGCLCSGCDAYILEHCFGRDSIAQYVQPVIGCSYISFCYNQRLCDEPYENWWKAAMEEAYHAYTICGNGPSGPGLIKYGNDPDGLLRRSQFHFPDWLDQHWGEIPDRFKGLGSRPRMLTNIDCLLREILAKICAKHGSTTTSVWTAALTSCGLNWTKDVPDTLYNEIKSFVSARIADECARINTDCGVSGGYDYGNPFPGRFE